MNSLGNFNTNNNLLQPNDQPQDLKMTLDLNQKAQPEMQDDIEIKDLNN
jgi:hypothetical protein